MTEILTPREVPLGGLRAMTVRRTLPQRQRSLIGAWCFLDHYGPDRGRRDRRHAGRAAPAHRPADGELAVQRRDRAPRQRRQPRAGAARRAEPDDGRSRHLPLRGVAPPRPPCCTASSCGWRCPTRTATAGRRFEHYAPPVRARPGVATRGCSSARCSAALAGRDLHARWSAPRSMLDPAARDVTLDSTALSSTACSSTPGPCRSTATEVKPNQLAYVAPGAPSVIQAAERRRPGCCCSAAAPFGEEIVMWWNFVGRDHDEIVAYRAEWLAQITAQRRGLAGQPGDRRRTVRHGRRRPPAADPRPRAAQRAAQAPRLRARARRRGGRCRRRPARRRRRRRRRRPGRGGQQFAEHLGDRRPEQRGTEQVELGQPVRVSGEQQLAERHQLQRLATASGENAPVLWAASPRSMKTWSNTWARYAAWRWNG